MTTKIRVRRFFCNRSTPHRVGRDPVELSLEGRNFMFHDTTFPPFRSTVLSPTYGPETDFVRKETGVFLQIQPKECLSTIKEMYPKEVW